MRGEGPVAGVDQLPVLPRPTGAAQRDAERGRTKPKAPEAAKYTTMYACEHAFTGQRASRQDIPNAAEARTRTCSTKRLVLPPLRTPAHFATRTSGPFMNACRRHECTTT